MSSNEIVCKATKSNDNVIRSRRYFVVVYTKFVDLVASICLSGLINCCV